MVVFTKHAREKFEILRRHGIRLSIDQICAAVQFPDCIDHSRMPLLIAQVEYDVHRVLRVVYKQEGTTKRIITFYPGRKQQYEKKSNPAKN